MIESLAIKSPPGKNLNKKQQTNNIKNFNSRKFKKQTVGGYKNVTIFFKKAVKNVLYDIKLIPTVKLDLMGSQSTIKTFYFLYDLIYICSFAKIKCFFGGKSLDL